MSLLLSITGNVTGGEAGTPTVRPTVTEVSSAPSEIVVQLTNFGTGDTIFFLDDAPDFSSAISVAGVAGVGTFSDVGEGTWYVRGKNVDESALFSNIIEIITTATPLRSLTITANAGDGQVTITHDCSASEPNTTSVSVKRRVTGSGAAMTEIATFSPTTSAYVDSTAVNGTTYDYRLDLIPSSIDYARSESNISSATPTASTPTLGAPNTLAVAWDEVTGGSGTFTFVDGSGGNADNYEVNIKVTSTGTSALSTTLTAPTASYAFSGLTVGVSYTFEVYATATSFNNSSTSSIVRTAINPAATALTPEDYGAEAYMKPLDGRLYDGRQFPLINYEPLTEAEFNTITSGSGLTYPTTGATRITSVDNLGNPITNVFTSNDVGKRFAGLRAHRNGAPGGFIDEYPAYDISTRYADVIWQNGNTAIVNFEYNGKAQPGDPSENLNGGRGYIFFDNKDAFAGLKTAIATDVVSANVTVEFLPLSRSNYVLTEYVLTEYTEGNAITGANNVTLIPATGDPTTGARFRVKFGVEDYYQFQPIEGAKKYTQTERFWNFSSYTGHFISHGGQWIAPHGSYPAADTWARGMFTGSLGGGGVAMIVHGENYAEYDELTAGYGTQEEDLFDVRSGNLANCGSYTGTTLATDDVQAFGFDVHVNVHYAGAYCAGGVSGGSTRGGQFQIFKDFVLDFEDQSKWAPITQTFTAKFTNDYSTLAGGGGDTSYLPSHCIEITSDAGNWFKTLTRGGANRTDIIHVDKFVFLGNATRYNQIHQWYNLYYDNGVTKIVSDNDGSYTRTPKKSMVDWEIIKEKENDGTTPKLIRVSRDYLSDTTLSTFQSADRNLQVGKVGVPMRNVIRTHPNWTTILQKQSSLVDSNDKAWIAAVDSKPKEWQVDDSFKLCAWIEVSDSTGLSVGDTVTGDTSGATGVIRYIDNYRYSHRLILGNATSATNVGNFSTDATLNSSAYTITDSVWNYDSTFDPSTVYTCSRKQRGQYVGSSLWCRAAVDDSSSFAAGQTVSARGGTWTATVDAVASGIITLKTIVGGRLQVGDTLTITSGGSGSQTVISDVRTNTGTSNDLFMHTSESGGSSEYALGYSNSDNRYAGGYLYSFLVLDNNLPYEYNGNDTYDPLLYIEVVNSEAEYLLDGVPRTMRHTYKGGPKFLTNSCFTEVYNSNAGNNKYLETGTLAVGYDNADVTNFDAQGWLSSGDAAGHLLYVTAERSLYWLDGDARNGFARHNDTSVSLNHFGQYSKALWIKDVINPAAGQMFSTESSSHQFENQRNLAIANPSYDPVTISGYAFDEEIGTDNAGNSLWPPKIGLYGSNSGDSIGSYSDPTGTNTVRSATSAHAPNLPKTVKDILTALGESTAIE